MHSETGEAKDKGWCWLTLPRGAFLEKLDTALRSGLAALIATGVSMVSHGYLYTPTLLFWRD